METFIPPCTANQSADACAKASGRPDPYSFTIQKGTVAPEGVAIGYGIGSFYALTTTSKLYWFNGTPNTKVGWNLLN